MASSKVTNELPDDPKLLEMVGRLAIRHGQLDHQLKMVIKTLKNIDPETAVDQHDFTTTNLRDEIKLLTKKRFGVESDVYRQLVGRLINKVS